MRAWFTIILALAALACGSAAAAAPAANDTTKARVPAALTRLSGTAAAARMRALLGDRPTLQGRFAQVVYDAHGGIVQQSQGTFTAQQPRQLRWQVQAPAAQLLVTDGARIWLYDPDLQQVTIDRLDAVTAEAPMLVLSGQVDALLSKFDLQGEGTGNDWSFRLRVRKAAAGRGAGFQSITVRLARGDLAGMTVQDGLGQRTELTFADVAHPARVDAKQFEFVVPPGTEVVQR